MTHRIDLPEHVYHLIEQAAEKEGLTPVEWIEATVSRIGVQGLENADAESGWRAVGEVLHGVVGSFDSSKEQCGDREIHPMAERVADKLQRQGIEVPWRRRP